MLLGYTVTILVPPGVVKRGSTFKQCLQQTNMMKKKNAFFESQTNWLLFLNFENVIIIRTKVIVIFNRTFIIKLSTKRKDRNRAQRIENYLPFHSAFHVLRFRRKKIT